MLHALNAKLNSLLIQSNITFQEKVKIVGTGSDGVVFTSDEIKQENGKPIAIKLFSVPEYRPHLKDARESISREQAVRELNALEIIRENPPMPDTPHSNFPKLCAHKIDIIEGVNIGDTCRSGYAVRMELIENSKPISVTSPIWGMEIRANNTTGINFNFRNDNICDIACQLRSALRYLQGVGLRHRHLEESNIHVRLPDLTVVIIDFARAYIPPRVDIKSSRETEISSSPPQEIMSKAKEGHAIGYQEIEEILEDDPEESTAQKEKEDLDALYFNSYASALSREPKYEDVSDYLAIRTVIIELWSTHIHHDLAQYEGNDEVIDENNHMGTLLLKSIIPEQEPETLPVSISRATYNTRAKRLEAINNIITRHGFTDCCKRVIYEFKTHIW